MKSASSSRLRAQASGLHAVKSRPDLKKEREVAGRKAEIKARMGRLGEERELRRMLGGEQGEDVDMWFEVCLKMGLVVDDMIFGIWGWGYGAWDAYDNVYDLTWLGSVVYRLRLDDACCACIVLESELEYLNERT
jgi:hypothetical protein